MIPRAYIDLVSASLSEESTFDELVEFLKNDPVGSQLLPLTRGPKCGAEVYHTAEYQIRTYAM